jgi:Super-infection exclusion protein B
VTLYFPSGQRIRRGSVAILDSINGAVKTFSELAVKPLIAIAVASGFLLFIPASVVAQLGMSKFVMDYRSWLGLAFVVSCAYLLAYAVVDLVKRVHDHFEVRAIRKAQSQYLRSLTPDERARLRPYIGEQRSSVVYQITDGVVGGLVGKGILFRSSNIGHGTGFAFNIQPWARSELEKNPSLLEGASPTQNHPQSWMGN